MTASIVERSSGNQFYAIELARHAQQAGHDVQSEVPRTIAASILRRVDLFGEKACRALQTAAAMGGGFDPRVLAQAADLADPTELLGTLEAAVNSGIVRRDR